MNIFLRYFWESGGVIIPMRCTCVPLLHPLLFPHMFYTQPHADMREFTYSTLLGALPQVIN